MDTRKKAPEARTAELAQTVQEYERKVNVVEERLTSTRIQAESLT